MSVWIRRDESIVTLRADVDKVDLAGGRDHEQTAFHIDGTDSSWRVECDPFNEDKGSFIPALSQVYRPYSQSIRSGEDIDESRK